jgi:hypothetical protein
MIEIDLVDWKVLKMAAKRLKRKSVEPLVTRGQGDLMFCEKNRPMASKIAQNVARLLSNLI